MKRFGNLFHAVYSDDNLSLAFRNSKKGKSSYNMVKVINENPQLYLEQIKQLISEKKFKNSAYRKFKINERGKEREISSLPYFPDRIIQHAIIQVIEPVFHRVYIEDTYASMKNRGIHAGVKRIKKALNDRGNTVYCLKLDIRKFYQSIDHNILKKLISRKIKDNQLIELLSVIIDSSDGLPIGNYLSQHLANYYLAFFDHFVKENLRIKYYFRYCDDMVLLHGNKETLHACRIEIKKYLEEKLNLELKNNYQVFPVESRGIDFIGYKFYHTHTLVRKRVKMKMIRSLRKNRANIEKSKASYYGWLKHSDAYNLMKKYNLKPYL